MGGLAYICWHTRLGRAMTTVIEAYNDVVRQALEMEAERDSLAKRIQDLEAEVAGLRKDAQRYRWLRTRAAYDRVELKGTGSSVDEAIDSFLAPIETGEHP